MVWNVGLGENQRLARNEDDPLVRPASGAGWQMADGALGDIDSNDGKVTGIELENIRTPTECDRQRAVGMWIRAESFLKHVENITIVMYAVKYFFRYYARMANKLRSDIIHSHIIRILREERIKRDISRTALAHRAGLSQPMMSYVEREMRKPTLYILLRIAEAMDVDLAKVIRRATKAASTLSRMK